MLFACCCSAFGAISIILLCNQHYPVSSYLVLKFYRGKYAWMQVFFFKAYPLPLCCSPNQMFVFRDAKNRHNFSFLCILDAVEKCRSAEEGWKRGAEYLCHLDTLMPVAIFTEIYSSLCFCHLYISDDLKVSTALKSSFLLIQKHKCEKLSIIK